MKDVRIGARGSRRGALVGAVAVGVLLLGACGSSDTDASGSSGGGGSTSSSRYSPLEEFLSPSSAGQTTSAEDYAAMDRKIQELIATCMVGQGFEYEPFVYPTTTTSPQPEMDWGSRAWTEKYGYGVSTMDQSVSGPATEVVDPNMEIMEAMSPGEQEAYSIALYGGGMSVEAAPSVEPAPSEAVSTDAVPTDAVSTDPMTTATAPPAADPSGELSVDAVATEPTAPVSLPAESVDGGEMSYPSMEEQGCWGQAQAEVYGDQNSGVNSPDAQAQFQPMWDAYSAMYSEVESDPRVTATVAAWKDCMSAAGHSDLTDIWSGNQQVNDKWSELNGWDTGGMVVDGGGAVMSTSSAAATSTSPSAPAPEAIAAFKEYEIALAVADWDCKDSSDYASVSDEVRVELEKKFLEDHRGELEAYRDLMNSGG